jgi:outer membrane receptor protein involved in Fe transport
MRNSILLLVILLWMTNLCYSQTKSKTENSATLTGSIRDSLTNETLPYSTINVVKQSSPTVFYKTFASDENGKFKFQLPYPEKYILSFASAGKSIKKLNVELTGNTEKDFGKILLTEKTNQLAEVEIVAAKPLIKTEIDRFSYNMDNDPDSKTSTLIEMIKKVPMLSVDNDENIKLKGGTKFKILMDGKETSMTADDLKNMMKATQANTIKEIQVITDPGAKYESDGLDGLINIVTQKNSKLGGYVVNLNAGADHFGGYNTGISTQIKYGKLGVNASVSRNVNKRPDSQSSSFREAYSNSDNKYMNSSGTSTNSGNSDYGSLRLNYEIDTLRLLSVSSSWNGYNGDYNSSNKTTMSNEANVAQFEYKSNSTETYDSKYINLNVNYQQTSAKNKDRVLTLSYQFSSQPRNNYSKSGIENILNYAGYDSESNSDQNGLTHTLQADYTTPIKKVHVIETGLKYSARINKSNSFYTIQYPSSSNKADSTSNNKFRNEQDVLSAYLSYRYTLGKKWSFRGGLRLENTKQSVEYPEKKAQDFENSYLSLVPSASISYKLTETQTLRTNYRMGMYRPGIWYLNPYNSSTDTLYVQIGNPNLKAEKYHNFGLGYDGNIKKVYIGINLNYSFSSNSINDITELKNNVTYTTYENIGKERRFGSWLNLSWTPNTQFRFSSNGGLSYVYYERRGTTIEKNSGVSSNVYGDINYTAPLKIKLGANVNYNSPWISSQGKGSSYFQYNFNLSRNFLKGDRLSVRMYANMPFTQNSDYKNTTETSTFYSENHYQYTQRRYGISISFRIGEMKVGIKETTRGISNDDMKGGGN